MEMQCKGQKGAGEMKVLSVAMKKIGRGWKSGGAVLLFCGMLAACSTVGEYRRPSVQLPAGYRGQQGEQSGDSSLATIPYNRFFSDPSLVALIDSAVVHNYDLLIALKNIDYAKKSLDAAGLGYLPTLTLEASASIFKPSENSTAAKSSGGKSVEDYTLGLSSSWEFDIWGKIRDKNKSALAEYLRSREAARAVRTRLVSDVAQGYYNLQMLDAQLDITRKNVALADTTLQMMRLQFDAGKVTGLALQQQESRLQAARLSIPKLEENVSVQENALASLTGRMPEAVRRTPGLASVAGRDSLLAGVPAALLQNRPDVRAAEASLMEKHASMGVAKAMLYPSFTITAQGGLNAFKSSDWFNIPGSIFKFAEGSILQPLFRRGELTAQFQQSGIRRDQAELTFKQSLLNAVGEVSDVLVKLEKTRQQERIAGDRVSTLRTAVQNSRLLFQSGMATYLEVITAQSDLLQSELEQADIRRQRLSAMAELYRALGGGWKE
jgi:NodT family efflux transporter outer membrane factor (OMF) lipoprotein